MSDSAAANTETAHELEPVVPEIAEEGSGPSLDELLDGRRLVTVSNREPFTLKKGSDGELQWVLRAGGLVAAIAPVMQRCGGVWVAWDPEAKKGEPEIPQGELGFDMRQVPLTQKEVSRYYHGFANRAMWPLSHDLLDRCVFDEHDYETYRRVNARFADAVADGSQPGDLTWVHDYHFCLLPAMIRDRKRNDDPIIYFHHIPWPAEEVFRAVPWREELLQGLLGADVVGFHTRAYARNFLICCREILGCEVDLESHRCRYQGRSIYVGSFPIGIDFDEFATIANKPGVAQKVAEIREHLGSEKIILGVDRLDYTKGVLERLLAVERLFERFPKYRGKVSFIQIAVPSRTQVEDYRELKSKVDETVGRINGAYSRTGWAPVLYMFRGLDRESLVAHYRAADVGLVTPLRDGMNLVAKEWVAAQVDDDGVLVLSEFAGASETMAEGSVVVNPYSIQDVASALDWSLTMAPEERKRRMKLLRGIVKKTDIQWWLRQVLRHSLESVEGTGNVFEQRRP